MSTVVKGYVLVTFTAILWISNFIGLAKNRDDLQKAGIHIYFAPPSTKKKRMAYRLSSQVSLSIIVLVSLCLWQALGSRTQDMPATIMPRPHK